MIGQNLKAKNEADYSDPNGPPAARFDNRQSANLLNRDSALPNSGGPSTLRTSGYPAGSQTGYPGGQQNLHTYYLANNPQPPEMMVYQEGEFKVVAQNLNDPKTMEASRESVKVVAEAVQALRSDSTSDEKRTEAKKVMTQYLEAHFDHDQKKRRQQLESLEAQVVNLKTQLEKRSQAKEQLIELRLTIMENDASERYGSWTSLTKLQLLTTPLADSGRCQPLR